MGGYRNSGAKVSKMYTVRGYLGVKFGPKKCDIFLNGP